MDDTSIVLGGKLHSLGKYGPCFHFSKLGSKTKDLYKSLINDGETTATANSRAELFHMIQDSQWSLHVAQNTSRPGEH